MHRRPLLCLCAGAVSCGCLGITGSSKRKIAWIHLENDRDEARSIDVLIERDGEAVFSETYRLGTGPERATVRVDDPVEGPGHYSLYLDIGEQEVHLSPEEFAELDIAEPCIGIRYTLHRRGTTGFEYEPIEEC